MKRNANKSEKVWGPFLTDAASQFPANFQPLGVSPLPSCFLTGCVYIHRIKSKM